MKHKRIIGLVIMGILAVVSIAGFVFAFSSSNNKQDIYANITATVDRDEIALDLEIEEDPDTDNGLRIVDSPANSAYFTITVGGLPDTADRGVAFDKVKGGVVDLTMVSFDQKTGATRFMVTGKNGGQTRLKFTTISGAREIYVTVTVNLTAKYVNVAQDAHFGVIKGKDLNLLDRNSLSKLTFYAHEKDTNQYYKPNHFTLTYALKEDYPGITLRDNILSVGESATAGQEIFLLATVAGMSAPVEIPVYIFDPLGEILVSSPTAFISSQGGVDYYDLILNRENKDSAAFNFALDMPGTVGVDYDFTVRSLNASIVSVNDAGVAGTRTFLASRNLGEARVLVTAYPRAKMTLNGVPNQLVWFDAAADADVQTTREVPVRVRNEFRDSAESILKGQIQFKTDELNAFYYAGLDNPYRDVFTLDTIDGLLINYDNDITFELEVKDTNTSSGLTGVYTETTSPIPGVTLKDVLDIRVLNDQQEWVSLWTVGGRAHYRSQFAVAMLRTPTASALLGNSITMKLRAKSVAPLSTGTATAPQYATCEVLLTATRAVDDFVLEGLNENGEVALVYNKNLTTSNQPVTIDLYSVVAGYDLGAVEWHMHKVTTNAADLPFSVEVGKRGNVQTYTFAVKANATVEYYVDYPFTFTYPNGVTKTINIKVYPYATTLAMGVVSDNDGIVYQTIKDVNNPEYIRTIYVKIGANYRINVDTPGVSVGARTTLNFQAVSEGLFSETVRLQAYSDNVFLNKALEFPVNIVVVNPVRNVVFSESAVNLTGIGAEKHIDITTTLTQTTANPYANLYIEQATTDPSVELVDNALSMQNGFTLRANYLVDHEVTLGFRVFKRFDYGVDLNGDDIVDDADVYEMPYTAGALLKINVTVENTNPVREISLSGDAIGTDMGNYLKLVSNTGTSIELDVSTVPASADNSTVALAFAKWVNGKFALDFDLDVRDFFQVTFVDGTVRKVRVTPVANKTSMGEYGLVVYACDSMRLVDGVAVPDTYLIMPIYMGTADEIESTIETLRSEVHDANSGKRNNLGAYNWIVPAADDSKKAALFYTETLNAGNYASDIVANRYYLDDLKTVLGWKGLTYDPAYCAETGLTRPFYLRKVVNGVSTEVAVIKDGNRYYFEITEASRIDHEVKYVLDNAQLEYLATGMEFYAVAGIERFEVSVSGDTGLVARKNLSPDGTDIAEFENKVSVHRGQYFTFTTSTNTATNTGWQSTNYNMSASGSLSYNGGKYEFIPYIEFDGVRFAVSGLKACVPVTTYGGVDYLNIAQVSTSINGAAAAIYDATVKIDRPWDPSLLDYWFVYNGVSYPLFQNIASANLATYVAMEGGNAGFLWRLACLNPKATKDSNGYYTYYLRLDMAIIIEATAVDPFRNIYSAQLVLRENLAGLPLTKEPVEKTAYLNVLTQGVTNVTFKHFANTVVEPDTGDLSVPANQTDTNNIYIDSNIAGGVLRVFPSPYYISVDNIKLSSSEYIMDVVVGKDLQGKDIIDQVRYAIGFTQLIYNKDTQTYQTFLSGSAYRMVSSWSAEGGYQWDGVYYFKTFLKYDGQAAQRLQDGTKFTVTVTLKSDGNTINESMVLYARYKSGIIVTPGDDVTGGGNANPINTMVQNRYQALGTSATYDIAFPSNYVADYTAYTVQGEGADYATIKVDAVAKTLTVDLAGNAAAINRPIEVRFPYKAQGDFVNPYLSVVINPVYFAVAGFTFANHPENPVQVTDNILSLRLRVVAQYNANLTVDMAAKLADFNAVLNNSKLVSKYDNGVNELAVNVPYTYVDGVPVITENGEIVREQNLNYTRVSGELARTEYQAIGLTQEYDLDIANKAMLNKVEKSGYDTAAWDAWLTEDGKIDVRLNYDLSLVGKILIIKVFSIYNSTTPEFTLNITPTYFTFTGFKLKDYPVNPLIALSKPFTVTMAADNLSYYNGTGNTAVAVNNAINAFNDELAQGTNLTFTRVAGDVLNFSYNNTTGELARIGDITATSYLKVAAKIAYVDGKPTLATEGNSVTSVFTVKTYGSQSGAGDNEDVNKPGTAPTTRNLKVAQGIGQTVTYNIALADVNYDSTLDKNEQIGARLQEWTADSGWNATLQGNQIVVTLAADTALFGKTLVIHVYSQEDAKTPVYTLNVVPAWFSVDGFEILNHPEKPLWIIAPETANDLVLDVNASYANIPGVDIEAKVEQFRNALNSSPAVVRVMDTGLLTIAAGLSFVNGQPNVVAISDTGAVLVQSVFAYELHTEAGPLTRTEAQVIGTEVSYLVNLSSRITSIKAFQDGEAISNAKWSASTDGNRRVTIKLNKDQTLIGKDLKVEVYTGSGLAVTLKIIPAYFVVNKLAVEGQSGNDDIWIITPDTPEDLQFVAVVSDKIPDGLGVPAMIDEFNRNLKESKNITRIYDQDTLAGNLRVTIFVDYVNGIPVISTSGIRLDTLFTYTIYAEGEYRPDYPDLPTGPRTRDEVQAIGLEARYKIDLPNEVAILNSRLSSGDNWSARWEDDEIVVTLAPDLELINTEIKLNLYSVFDNAKPIFVLTIKPVLFEVVGFAIVGHPEQPVCLVSNSESLGNLQYQAVAKYAAAFDNDPTFKNHLAKFNENLNALVASGDTRFYETEMTDGRFWTLRTALNYNINIVPTFRTLASNPTSTVETTFEYQYDTINHSATKVQAIGTTERYQIDTLDIANKQYTVGNISNGEVRLIPNTNIVEVKLAANATLLRENPIVRIYETGSANAVFTINITPVWFKVEGLEVANHPERHMWLIAPEKVADLNYSVKAKHTDDSSLKPQIMTHIAAFNENLNGAWRNYLEKTTVAGAYLTVKAAITYQEGVPTVVYVKNALLTDVVKSTFQYKIYRNSGNEFIGDGIAYPTSPRYLVANQAVGLSKQYHIDLPDLETYSFANLVLTEETASGGEVKWSSWETNGWRVTILDDNRVEVQLSTNATDLIKKRLKVYIYYAPENPNPAFILNIDPVWFTVNDIAVVGHPEQPLVIADDDPATLEALTGSLQYAPVAEYSREIPEAQTRFEAFKANFNTEGALTKFIAGPYDGKYYLTATTGVSYVDGEAVLSTSPTGQIWRTVEVVVGSPAAIPQQTAVQALGTTKSYNIDIASTLLDREYTADDNSWHAVVDNNEVTVTLTTNANLIGTDIAINLDNKFILNLTPVWFEVEGFEVVGHPERPVWVFAPSSTSDLTYRVRTNKIPATLDLADKIAAFNTVLNDSRTTLISETIKDNKYIVLRAAIDYNAQGLPEIVRIDPDPRNVVEEVIEYHVWCDGRTPVPEHPPVMGALNVNQAIGTSKSFNLSNINGKFYYQYLWLEGAGDLTSAMTAASVAYQGASVAYDTLTNQITVTLAANTDYLTRTIKVYLPYFVTVNNEDVWYSYCLEIKPLLFEVTGWGLDINDALVRKTGNYIYLGGAEGHTYGVQFYPYVNRVFNEDQDLQTLIDNKIAYLTDVVNSKPELMRYLISATQGENFALLTNGTTGKRELKQLTTAEIASALFLTANIEYDHYGMVQVLPEGEGTAITTELRIYTGTGLPQPWPPEQIAFNAEKWVQAIGTTRNYAVTIAGATEILYQEIWYDDVVINGESMVTVALNNKQLTVTLAAQVPLLSHGAIEIGIPYKVLQDGAEVKYYYSLQICPVLYQVDGFQLVGHETNVLDLGEEDVPLAVKVKATYTDDSLLRNEINLAINTFTEEVNTLIRGTNFYQYEAAFTYGDKENPHFRIVNIGGQLWLQKLNNVTATGTLTMPVMIGYELGKPAAIDFLYPERKPYQTNGYAYGVYTPVALVINTTRDVTPAYPGLDNIKMGANMYSEYSHAIGTSKTYTISTQNANQTFYFRYLEVANAGPMRSPDNYEYVDIKYDGTNNFGEITVTMKADARLMTAPLEIYIPYTEIVEGKAEWFYYALKVRPVLFEVVGWGLQDGDKVVQKINLSDFAQELYFKAIIRSAPLVTGKDQCFTDEDLYFIEKSLQALETQINEYNESISDKFTYMVIHNVPQEGYQVNYTTQRDESTGKIYLVRDILEASTTVMKLSAKISYRVNGFDTEIVDSAQAIVGYDDQNNGEMIESTVEIVTTDQTIADDSLTVITQANAYLLGQLRSGTDYILMSDIYLSQINEGGWAPAVFPENTTLDGNNYKIYVDGQGFNLSNNPTDIGVFQSIPQGSVVKNVQVVLPSKDAQNINQIQTLTVNLANYQGGNLNIGVLAGVNNGIITNCAVLSEWQFMQNMWNVTNPVTGGLFYANLRFNMDGYLFDDDYFYEPIMEDGQIKRIDVYNNQGHLLVRNEKQEWVEALDKWHNNLKWLTPDKTNVARYDNYCAMTSSGASSARLLVTNSNRNLNVVLGGLVGANNYMMTNSRVLIDVELDGPPITTSSGQTVEVTAASTMVGGVVGSNIGTITASFFRDGNVINNAYVGPTDSNNVCYLGGFVGNNQKNGIITSSYAMGRSVGREDTDNFNFTATAGRVQTIRNLMGGFVHQNAGTVKDCFVNMVIEKKGEGLVGGFVYKNTSTGTITNCIANNRALPIPGGTMDYYQAFIVLNDTMTTADATVSYKGLNNLFYAGAQETSHRFTAAVTRLSDEYKTSTEKFSVVSNYAGFSIGEGDGNNDWGISANNTVWQMTDLGPDLRTPNDIAVSFKKTQWANSPYLYNPGTAKNPILIWNQERFRQYVYEATPEATAADAANVAQDLERNRQGNHLRMVDNITLDVIPDTYKITYTGVFEGNGLTMDGINLPAVSSTAASIGLFGKLEYATIRNTTFKLSATGINANGMRYVGGLAGIAINTNFVDVTMDGTTTAVVTGANIVGGIAGLAVVTDPTVENYNVTSNVSVTAYRNRGATSPNDSLFSSGVEYYQQTLYALDTVSNIERAYGTAGAVFGFITSNPNNYRTVNAQGETEIIARTYVGKPNQDAALFMKDAQGKVIDDTGKYFTDQIILRQVGGAVQNVRGAVAGGLIGIMDETIELRDAQLTSLRGLAGKYYLGGLVGINLGKISGGTVDINSFNASTSADNGTYVFRASESVTNPIRFWGMTIGAVAAYNDGIPGNEDSGLIENLKVDVNMLGGNAKNIYVIGGVVGVNGDNGYIDGVTNVRYNSTTNPTIRLTSTQWNSVGYYFGNVVGRGNVNVDANTGLIQSFTGFEQTRYALVRLPSVDTGTAYFVSPVTFATPGFKVNGEEVNAFGVEKWRDYTGAEVDKDPYTGTRKVQTLTIDEYKDYIAYTVSIGSVVDRIKVLEVLYRTLPTQTMMDYVDGKVVAVERVRESYRAEFLAWIQEKGVFDYGIPTQLRGKLFADYQAYTEYAALGENLAWLANKDNLAASRSQRFAQAVEFFTYKSTFSGGAAGLQNANLTWDEYMNYLYVKEHASREDSTTPNDGDLRQTWTKPYQQLAEYQKDEAGNGSIVYINNNKDLLDLLADAPAPFTADDPLQGYINYIVSYSTTTAGNTVMHESRFKRGTDWYLTLPQYYYYVKHVMNQTYGTAKIKCTAEKYADYLYTLYNLQNANLPLITLAEFLTALDKEQELTISYEGEWVRTGTFQEKDVGTPAGGSVLKWATPWDEIAIDKVKEDLNNIYLQEEDGRIPDNCVWAATVNYSLMKQLKGLDIIKYEQIRLLGGTLYELFTNDTFPTADSYIFYLKMPQYGWTPAQGDFIRKYYDLNDLKYAVSATYYGDILQQGLENARSVDVNRDNSWNGSVWFHDANGNGYDHTDTVGIWQFAKDTTYAIPGGDAYTALKDIDLRGSATQGAALYSDSNGDKLFSPEFGDKLYLYEVADAGDADFKLEEENEQDTVTKTTYFKISRYIVADENLRRTPNNDFEKTGNCSDYLEEALWWKNEEFTAQQFDSIKHHAMTEANTKGGIDIKDNTDGSYKIGRNTGFVLADDWTFAVAGKEGGFKNEKAPLNFTPMEYTSIVLGADYEAWKDQEGNPGKRWNSTFAEYKLFCFAYNANLNPEDFKDYVNKMDAYVPGTDTPYLKPDADRVTTITTNLVSQTELADAISFTNDKQAYIKFAEVGGTVKDYVDTVTTSGFKINQSKYYRLNQYIYIKCGKLTANDLNDFNWALTEKGVRSEIYYAGVTAEDKTSELLEYRKDWVYRDENNQERAYMTFRDYCEWINVFAHDDAYKMDRGDLVDGQVSPDAWLTIESYAVWKRMEKYENNTVYIAKSGNTSGVLEIKAPILKRQISTTIFPRIYSSGKAVNADGVTEIGKEPTLPSNFGNGMADYFYKWQGNTIPAGRQRPYVDRFEYNEQYEIKTLDNVTRVVSSSDKLNNTIPTINSVISMNRQTVADAWITRYGAVSGKYNEAVGYTLMLDEVWAEDHKYQVDEKSFTVGIGEDEQHKPIYLDTSYQLPHAYAQLYIPYEVFEQAVKKIKAAYSDTNDYAGFKNYMKYWARNGEWNWIASTEEYSDPALTDKQKKIQYNYLETGFWDNFDGTKSPLDGSAATAVGDSKGWYSTKQQQQ